MDSACNNCVNFDTCKKIQEGNCTSCPESMSRLSERGCSYGSEDCVYVKKRVRELKKLNSDQDCVLHKVLLEIPKKCPRCFGETINTSSEYESELKGLVGGAKIVEYRKVSCSRCQLGISKRVDE